MCAKMNIYSVSNIALNVYIQLLRALNSIVSLLKEYVAVCHSREFYKRAIYMKVELLTKCIMHL